MSFLVRTYECPACSKRITVMQEPEEGPPLVCAFCKTDFGEAEPVPGTHAIGGSAIARSTDGMYRELETTSAARAEALNAPHLKITDLNDRLREGDVAAKAAPVSREFQIFKDENKNLTGRDNYGWGGGFQGQSVGRVAPPIPTGTPGQAFTGPGHIALAGAQGDHAQRVAQIVANPSAKPYVSGR